MHIAVKFAYDGRYFHGYARQPQLKTVEGEIIEKLVQQSFIDDTEESFFKSASRTDKDVSALCNVMAFNTNSSKKHILQELSNKCKHILFYGIKDVETEFNPRYAIYRNYRYYLTTEKLDINKVISAASLFAGEHNFSNFAKVEPFKEPVRNINNIVFTFEKNF